MLRLFLLLCLAMPSFAGVVQAEDWRSGQFVLSDWDGPPINVYYVEPASDDLASAPVVIVMHGVNRNADEYAANWQALVSEYGLRVYAPEFSQESFPGAAYYNLGGVGTEGPFAYGAIEPLFTEIQRRAAADEYYLFGHSAGAQFVHRALLFEALPHLDLAFSANAGWYSMPDEGVAWPYGLEGLPLDGDDLSHWVSRPMVILLGDQDIDPDDPNLRRTPEADAQGPHRYARGERFAAAGEAQAEALGADYGWHVISVPGVAHDNAGMAIAAAALIAGQTQALRSPEP